MRPWPLLGRDEEVDQFDALVARDDVHGILISAPAGVGATRLARELVRRASRHGLPVEWAVATAAARVIPFGALAHLVHDTDESGGTPRSVAEADPLEVLRRTAKGWRDRLAGQRLVLGVDDAHLLDDHSAALLHHLVITDVAFVVATVRAEEPRPDPITALVKEGLVQLVELHPLTRDDVEALLPAALGGSVDSATIDRLAAATRGNALFLHELVQGALDNGTLIEVDGTWRWRGPFVPPRRLIEVVEARLGGVSPVERRALEAVAIAEPVELALLVAMFGSDVVERLETRHVLSIGTSGDRHRAALSHPMYGEVLRAQTPRLRGRDIRRQLADALDATGTRRELDLLRITTWRLDAGVAVPADRLLAAADAVLTRYDPQLAERFATSAFKASGRPDAALRLAAILGVSGRGEEAESVLSRVDTADASERDRVHMLVARAQNLTWGLGRFDEAMAVLDRGLAEVTEQRSIDEIHATEALLLTWVGRPREAAARTDPLLHRDDVEPRTRLRAGAVAAMAAVEMGAYDRALSLVDEHTERARGQGNLGLTVPFMWWTHGLALFRSGQLDDAEVEADRVHRRSRERGADGPTGFSGLLLGQIAIVRGQLRRATELLTESEERLAAVNRVTLHEARAYLALAAAWHGDIEGARKHLDSVEAFLTAGVYAERQLAGVRPWVAAAAGEVSRARQLAAEAAAAAAAAGAAFHELNAWYTVARLGGAAGVVDRVAAIALTIDGPFARLVAMHVEALANRDRLMLDRVAAELGRLGHRVAAAEAATAAHQLHQRAGDTAGAAASAATVRDLLARLDGVRTPGLAQGDVTDPLTAREREVATLAANGLTNKQIAGRLYVSVRTVDAHLRSVYSKLAVDGRGELAAALGLER